MLTIPFPQYTGLAPQYDTPSAFPYQPGTFYGDWVVDTAAPLTTFERWMKAQIVAHRAKYPKDIIVGGVSGASSPGGLSWIPMYSSAVPDRLEYSGTIFTLIDAFNLNKVPDGKTTWVGGGSVTETQLDPVSQAKQTAYLLELCNWQSLLTDQIPDFLGQRAPWGQKEYEYFVSYAPRWTSSQGPSSNAYAHLGVPASDQVGLIKKHFSLMHFRGDDSLVSRFWADPRNQDHFPGWIDNVMSGLIIGVSAAALAVGGVAIVAGAAAGGGTAAAGTAAAASGETAAAVVTPVASAAPAVAGVEATAAVATTAGTAAAGAGVATGGGLLGGIAGVATTVGAGVIATVEKKVGSDLVDLIKPPPAPKPTLTLIPGGAAQAVVQPSTSTSTSGLGWLALAALLFL